MERDGNSILKFDENGNSNEQNWEREAKIILADLRLLIRDFTIRDDDLRNCIHVQYCIIGAARIFYGMHFIPQKVQFIPRKS